MELPLFVPCEKHDLEVRVHIKNCEKICKRECAMYLEHVAALGDYRGVSIHGVGGVTVTEDLNPKVDYDTMLHIKAFKGV